MYCKTAKAKKRPFNIFEPMSTKDVSTKKVNPDNTSNIVTTKIPILRCLFSNENIIVIRISINRALYAALNQDDGKSVMPNMVMSNKVKSIAGAENLFFILGI